MKRGRGLAAAFALVALGVLAEQAGGSARSPLSVGSPFTLAYGFQYDLGAGSSALGPDGTVWLAQPTAVGGGFAIVARSVAGRARDPGTVAATAGAAWSRPAIATSAGAATFVWETATDITGPGGVAAVRALRCTPAACGAVQTLSSWRWTYDNDSFPASGYQARPAVASAGDQTIAVFLDDSESHPQLMWAQSSSGRFGAPRAIGATGAPDPLLVGEAHGRVLAAWLGDGSGVGWAVWTAQRGFTHPAVLAGGRGGHAAELVGTPLGAGAAVAWIQGDNATDPGLLAEPVWVARQGPGGFARPVRVFPGYASELSIAGGDGVLALAFTTTARAGLDADTAGPAMVTRSVGGAPFGAPVTLDAAAAPGPAVAVDGRGDVLAAWNDGGAHVALAAARGAFGPPLALGSELRSDSPALHANGARSVIVWQAGSQAGWMRGAPLTP